VKSTFATVGRIFWVVVKKRGPYVVCHLGRVKNVVEGSGPGRIKRLNQLDSWVSIYLIGGIAGLGKGALDLNRTLTPPEDVKEIITISSMGIPKLERKGRYFSCT